MTRLTRRQMMMLSAAALALPRQALASDPAIITWDDLLPPNVDYGQIIGDGMIDEENDIWRPQYDENASKLNPALDGKLIRMPGYVLPLDFEAEGISDFLLVPYVGACIHVPPPPPNQLVLAHSATPWMDGNMWDPVWVEGEMTAQLATTDIADTGYKLNVTHIELYDW